MRRGTGSETLDAFHHHPQEARGERDRSDQSLGKPVIHRQQRIPFPPACGVIREHQRERPQNVLELLAGQSVQVGDNRVDFVAEALALVGVECGKNPHP